MRAVAHSPSFAKKMGIPQAVGQKFEAHGAPPNGSTKPQSKAEGGPTMKKESPAMMKKEVAFMKKKGAPKAMIKHEMAEAKGKPFAKGGGVERKGKTKGKMVKMAYGGKAC